MTFSRDIAARTLWMEARGEPADGQRAVAHVIVNRVKDGRWGPNLASVCLAPSQFSCWNTKDPNRIAAARLADEDLVLQRLAAVLNSAATGADTDPTNGATHYYNPDVVAEPPWVIGATLCGRFGHHLFYKNVR